MLTTFFYGIKAAKNRFLYTSKSIEKILKCENLRKATKWEIARIVPSY